MKYFEKTNQKNQLLTKIELCLNEINQDNDYPHKEQIFKVELVKNIDMMKY